MIESKQSVLYISLTGMTEPLGRSQVLEYLLQLSDKYLVLLISFEREKDLHAFKDIEKIMDEHGIAWQHKVYSNRFGIFSTMQQIFSATILAYTTVRKQSIKVVHARSLIPAVIGMILKKLIGVKLIFDIRGFATAEKVDTGRVKKGSWLYRLMNSIEKYLYQKSDYIVTLTHMSRTIILEDFNVEQDKISVIPTCANKRLFKSLSTEENRAFKQSLGYKESDKIILHSGTVGGWYDFESEVKLFKEVLNIEPNAKFLILNRDRRVFIEEIFAKYSIVPSVYKITQCSLDEVHRYLNIADVSLFFIHPSYSKIASTPTKFAENLACHLPSITNKGVGDMEYFITQYGVGEIVDLSNLDNNLEATAKMVAKYFGENNINKQMFEKLYQQNFDTIKAVRDYADIYDKLMKEVQI